MPKRKTVMPLDELHKLIDTKKKQVEQEKAQEAASTGNNERLTIANSIWEKGISWGEREARFEKHKQLHPERFPGKTIEKTLRETVDDIRDNQTDILAEPN